KGQRGLHGKPQDGEKPRREEKDFTISNVEAITESTPPPPPPTTTKKKTHTQHIIHTKNTSSPIHIFLYFNHSTSSQISTPPPHKQKKKKKDSPLQLNPVSKIFCFANTCIIQLQCLRLQRKRHVPVQPQTSFLHSPDSHPLLPSPTSPMA